MAVKVRDMGGTLRTITNMKAQDGATLRTIRTAKVMGTDNVTLRTVAIFTTPMTISTPSTGYYNAGFSSLVAIGPVTATPVGGTAPYTYTCVVIAGACTVVSPTSASSEFYSPALSSGQYATATVRWTVTDAAGQTASCDVDLAFEYL